MAESLRVGRATRSRLPGGLLVAERSAIDPGELAQLKEAGALRPVFRKESTMLVPMAEVRIEFDDAEQRAAIEKVLANPKHALFVAEEGRDLMVLRPVSGDAMDALEIANDVFERAHPAAASVRFVQIVERPELKR
jgi:hypothetical protein